MQNVYLIVAVDHNISICHEQLLTKLCPTIKNGNMIIYDSIELKGNYDNLVECIQLQGQKLFDNSKNRSYTQIPIKDIYLFKHIEIE